jgi:hypothetical protein
MKDKKGIIATIHRKRKHCPKQYFFATLIQNDVENAMADLQYGCDQYMLQYGILKWAGYHDIYPKE